MAPLSMYRSMVLAAAAIACAVALPARASDTCIDLRAQLASLPPVADRSSETRRYSNEISQRNLQLRKARADLRRLGCSNGSVKIYGGANADECAAVEGTTAEIERSLQALEQRRNAIAHAGDRTARATLLADLELYGCNETIANGRPAEEQLAYDSPVTMPDEEFGDDGLSSRYAAAPGYAPAGRLKTVCVRTCDGAFFPIAHGVSPLDFRRDQRLCTRMCPQTETELFYEALDSVDTGQMVSTVTGRTYARLPNAFAYRTRDAARSEDCGCDLAAYYRQAAGGRAIPLAGRDTGSGLGAAKGLTRDDAGSVTTIRMRPVGTPASEEAIAERPFDPAKDKVRSVGPVFLPDKEHAIDLRNPAGAN